jgi:MFS family permease
MYHGNSVANIHRIASKKEELKELYASLILRSLAFSLIGLFIPVYLLTLGFSLPDVIIFEILSSLVIILVSPLVVNLASSIGIKHTMLISVPIVLLFLGSFLYIQVYSIPLVIVAVFKGMMVPFYWVPLNSDFSKSEDKKASGRESAYYHVLPKLAGVFGPIGGGLVASLFGFSSLFWIAGIMVLGSAITPLASSDYKSAIAYQWKNLIRVKGKMLDSLVAEGILMGAAILIYPLYVYQSTNSVVALGEMGSVLYFGTFVFTLLAGWFSDKFSKRTLIRIGGLVLAIGWLLLFLGGVGYHAISSAIIGIGGALIAVPIFAKVTSTTNASNRTELMALREMSLRVGMVICLLAFLLAPEAIRYLVGFGMAVLASLYFVFRGI